jgi:hypothetical protein
MLIPSKQGVLYRPSSLPEGNNITHIGKKDSLEQKSHSSKYTYPSDGRIRTKIISFSNEGAVVDLNTGEGLYLRFNDKDLDNPVLISLADDPNYTVIEADKGVKEYARKLQLKATH